MNITINIMIDGYEVDVVVDKDSYSYHAVNSLRLKLKFKKPLNDNNKKCLATLKEGLKKIWGDDPLKEAIHRLQKIDK